MAEDSLTDSRFSCAEDLIAKGTLDHASADDLQRTLVAIIADRAGVNSPAVPRGESDSSVSEEVIRRWMDEPPEGNSPEDGFPRTSRVSPG